MNVLQLIASSSFLTVNMAIAKQVGNDAAILLAELASSQVYFENNGMLTDGMFFETVELIEDRTNLTKYQQSKAVKVLEETGILKTKLKGIPAKRYFAVDGEKILELVDCKKSKNLTTGCQKTSPQEVKKLDRNNKRYNKNREIIIDKNNIVSESSLSEPVKEKVLDFLGYREEIKKPYKSERSIQSFVKQVEKQEQIHGSIAVIECIDKSIQNGWQGVFWDKIENSRPTSKFDMIDQWAANMERKSNEDSGIF